MIVVLALAPFWIAAGVLYGPNGIAVMVLAAFGTELMLEGARTIAERRRR